jgi:hypothetical protein
VAIEPGSGLDRLLSLSGTSEFLDVAYPGHDAVADTKLTRA